MKSDQPQRLGGRQEVGHIPALDGVRGLAILAVLVFHFAAPLLENRHSIFQKAIGVLVGGGWTGVDLFFVLSGFLITRNLLSLGGDVSDRLGEFWRNRALRIFPIYFLFLITYAVVVGNPPLSYWLYYSNWTQPFHLAETTSPLAHFWSLAVEEQFYLVWPLAALLLGRRALFLLSLSVVLIVPILRGIATALGWSPFLIYRATIFRADALMCGALIAQGANWKAVLWIGGAATVPILLICKGFTWAHPLMQTIGYSAISLLFAGFVGMAVAVPMKPLTAPLLRTMGKYSYGAYVYHWPLAYLAWRSGVSHRLGTTVSLLMLLAEFIAVFLAAMLSYELIERRFLRLRSKRRQQLSPIEVSTTE